MRIEIDLNFSRKDFEDVYFKNDQGNYFLSPTTKPSGIAFLVCAVFAGIAALYGNKTLIVLGLIALSMATIAWLNACRLLYNWKRQVSKSLDHEQQFERYKLILSDESFSLIQDEKETIERWTNFTSGTIDSDHIFLQGQQNFILPKKSVSASDYETLKKTVSEKLK